MKWNSWWMCAQKIEYEMIWSINQWNRFSHSCKYIARKIKVSENFVLNRCTELSFFFRTIKYFDVEWQKSLHSLARAHRTCGQLVCAYACSEYKPNVIRPNKTKTKKKPKNEEKKKYTRWVNFKLNSWLLTSILNWNHELQLIYRKGQWISRIKKKKWSQL